MYDLYPYFTNDGTVGLFSKKDDDIYHSTYGALSESWQKFILPSNLAEYILNNNTVKILDLCYGIGYNTKSALNVFIKQIVKDGIYAIHTDNISNFKNNKKLNFNSNNCSNPNLNNDTIYTDNISNQEKNSTNQKKEFYIDAIDIDNILINISPFITRGINNNFFNKNLFEKQLNDVPFNRKNTQVRKIKNSKFNPLPKMYKIKKEVLIILLMQRFNQIFLPNKNLPQDKITKTILTSNKFLPFFDKYMLNFGKFYINSRLKDKESNIKPSFLHNIYYQYISKSYKNAKNILRQHNISINFYNQDARKFVYNCNNKYNFIFLDAFTPVKCPALWTIQFFKLLFEHLADDGMILTYSTSSAVRNAFLQNGFYVGKIYDEKLKKYIGTVASKKSELIKYPLEQYDIDLINSKAGICFYDENLSLDNSSIIANREELIKNSDLETSSKILKGYKNGNVESL